MDCVLGARNPWTVVYGSIIVLFDKVRFFTRWVSYAHSTDNSNIYQAGVLSLLLYLLSCRSVLCRKFARTRDFLCKHLTPSREVEWIDNQVKPEQLAFKLVQSRQIETLIFQPLNRNVTALTLARLGDRFNDEIPSARQNVSRHKLILIRFAWCTYLVALWDWKGNAKHSTGCSDMFFFYI